MKSTQNSGKGGSALPRRAFVAGAGAAGVGLALAGPGRSLAATATPAAKSTAAQAASARLAAVQAAAKGFNWEKGNMAYQIAVYKADPVVQQWFTGSMVPLVVRYAALLENAWFDAIAPYTPTCVGVYSKLGRRPPSESVTNRNRNIAILYASYNVLQLLLPEASEQWREMVKSYGMDPDDHQENKKTPIGIGNLAAKGIAEARSNDGSNMLGNVGGWKYNRMRYRDYTGYQPDNTAYELTDPDHWQPSFLTNQGGDYQIQQFIMPQCKLVTPYTFTDPAKYLVPPPVKSNWFKNPKGYKEQADQVLARSAALDDRLKMEAEFFNDKFLALGESVGIAAKEYHLDLDRFVQLHLATAVASFDATIAVWYNKYHYNSVRPFSAIPYIYGDRPVTAWGGVGLGTVHNMPGNEWIPYIPTADHPEYPSVSTTICEAHARAAALYLGTNKVDLTFTFPKGSSVIEPGIVPHKTITVHYGTWTEFAHICGQARINGGVHFPTAVEAGYKLGPQFGVMGYDFVMKYVRGDV
jgi:hypothetical protein